MGWDSTQTSDDYRKQYDFPSNRNSNAGHEPRSQKNQYDLPESFFQEREYTED